MFPLAFSASSTATPLWLNDNWRKQRLSLATNRLLVFPDWRLAAELGKINFGLESQAFAVVSTSLLLIPK
jgi:hypothetical protein